MAEIYGLHDPETDELRYIGKAICARKRLGEHMREGRRRTPLYCWIKSLRARSLAPALRIREVVPDAEWPAAERRHIAEARALSPRILNLADGGDQPHCPTHIRAQNGRLVAASRDRHIWRIKRAMGSLLKDGCVSAKTKASLRWAAMARPDLFGEWATL